MKSPTGDSSISRRRREQLAIGDEPVRSFEAVVKGD